MKRKINNRRDGYHFNSLYWQTWKLKQPALNSKLFEIAVAMVLSDATMAKTSTQALIKFEQGYKQENFLYHLFYLFKGYSFMDNPGSRVTKDGPRKGLTKSFWFKTFSHPSFTAVYNLFYTNLNCKTVKTVNVGLVTNHINSLGLAYWIMGDGSLNKDCLILHTQGFTYSEQLILSNELNAKFGFHSIVIPHKTVYHVIKIPGKDLLTLRDLIQPHIIPSMSYKVPK